MAGSAQRPTLSIVVAAFNGSPSLEQCLVSLKGQAPKPDTEVVVVSNYRDGVGELERRFPDVSYICMPVGTTVPDLRKEGIKSAKGEIVALAEDHCVFDENWCAELKLAHESDYQVIGGSVENADCNNLLDWAVYFYEYGRYMPPNRPGVVDALSGNNVSYKRRLLEKMEGVFEGGFYEVFMHWKIREEGNPLFLAPSVIVYHKKSYRTGPALMQCYHHGRSFGAMRVLNATILKRGGFALASLLLPLLLPSRIALGVIRKGRRMKELILCLPYLVLLMASWSYGEFCGYLFGEGESAARWA